MGNKPKKQAKEPIEKGFGNDKLGTIVRKERHKIEAATEWDELEVVRKSITNHDYTTASTPENVAHNRYPNVMALEATRVKFTNRYINANWIDEHAYIATQAPLEESFDRFWEMVWHSKASVIVMLTNFVESQKRKADQYWPKTLDESLKYGDFERRPLSRVMAEKVQCQLLRLTKQGKNSQYTAYIVRKFCLRNLSPSPSTTVKETKSELTSKRAEKKALPSSRSETDTASSKAPFGSRTDVPPQKKKRPHREKEVAETRRTPRTGRERSKSDAERHPDVNEDKGKEKLDPPTKANSEIKGRRKPKGGKGKDKEEKQDTAKLEERIVYHYHYCSWPDMDVPSNGNDLIEMMQAATQLENGEDHTGETGEGAHDEESVAPPTVVHCSAGIGRAGTYILIHTALAYALENKMEDYSTVPVKEVVLKLRQQRCGMIQTKEQYIFSASVIRDFLNQDRPGGDSTGQIKIGDDPSSNQTQQRPKF